MKRHGWLILLVAASCTPQYESGKTQCSDKRECPGGYSCSDDGTTAVHFCEENKKRGCPDNSILYCSQSGTCWDKLGACSTVTHCGTAKHPGNEICPSPGYHFDCNGDACLPNGPVTGKGGAGGSIGVGVGGRLGSGGAIGFGGTAGKRDAGVPDARSGGIIGYGGAPLVRGGTYGTGGVGSGRGGSYGYGGVVPGRGGTVGYGGTIRTPGSGGITGRGGSSGTVTCSGTANTCSIRTVQWECQYTAGCIWNTSTETCSGTPSACATNTSSTSCILNGCTWSGALTCNKTPMTDICAGITPANACETCMYGSCCGQMVACASDTTCLDGSTGPLWNAYMDCVANCCYSSCAF